MTIEELKAAYAAGAKIQVGGVEQLLQDTEKAL